MTDQERAEQERIDRREMDQWMLEMMNAYIHRQGHRPARLIVDPKKLTTDAGRRIRDIAERYEHDLVTLEFGSLEGPSIRFCNREDL